MGLSILKVMEYRHPTFVGPFTRVVYVKLMMRNQSDKRLAFKIKTLEPKRFVVRPGKGFIEPKCFYFIVIRLKPIRDMDKFDPSKQKFLVQSLIIEQQSNINEMVCAWQSISAI